MRHPVSFAAIVHSKFLAPLSLLLLLAGLCAQVGCVRTARQTDKANKRIDLAKGLLQQGQDAAAETELNRAMEFDPKNEEGLNILGLVYMARAERNIRLVEIDDCPGGIVAESLRAEASEHMRRAAQFFERATKLSPTFGEGWQNRGVVAMYFEDWDKAIEYQQMALGHLGRIESEALVRANLGWSYFQKRDYVRAATELLQATQREPQFCLGNYRLGEVLLDRRDYAEAAERLLKVVAPDSGCPPIQQAFYVAGKVYVRARDNDSAANALARCVELAPKSCVAKQCLRTLDGLGVTPYDGADESSQGDTL